MEQVLRCLGCAVSVAGKETEVPAWNFCTTSMFLESCWPPLKGGGYKGACGAVTCSGPVWAGDILEL